MWNTCNVKKVESLPEINLSRPEYRMTGTDNIDDHSAERWFYKVPSRCSYMHDEYKNWWFAQLGEPKVEVPVKYEHYNSAACGGHQGTTEEDIWVVDSFTNDVDGRVFAVPEACLKLDE